MELYGTVWCGMVQYGTVTERSKSVLSVFIKLFNITYSVFILIQYKMLNKYLKVSHMFFLIMSSPQCETTVSTSPQCETTVSASSLI